MRCRRACAVGRAGAKVWPAPASPFAWATSLHLMTPHPLPTPHSPLPTPHSPLPTLPTPNSPHPTAHAALLRLNSVPAVCAALMAAANLCGGCAPNCRRLLRLTTTDMEAAAAAGAAGAAAGDGGGGGGIAPELQRLLRVRGELVCGGFEKGVRVCGSGAWAGLDHSGCGECGVCGCSGVQALPPDVSCDGPSTPPPLTALDASPHTTRHPPTHTHTRTHPPTPKPTPKSTPKPTLPPLHS